jgi:hypothetical protein
VMRPAFPRLRHRRHGFRGLVARARAARARRHGARHGARVARPTICAHCRARRTLELVEADLTAAGLVRAGGARLYRRLPPPPVRTSFRWTIRSGSWWTRR